ncbi:MAG: hypothetical protein AB7Q17_16195 [Phycisphaerae bacterium]
MASIPDRNRLRAFAPGVQRRGRIAADRAENVGSRSQIPGMGFSHVGQGGQAARVYGRGGKIERRRRSAIERAPDAVTISAGFLFRLIRFDSAAWTHHARRSSAAAQHRCSARGTTDHSAYLGGRDAPLQPNDFGPASALSDASIGVSEPSAALRVGVGARCW